MVVLDNPNDYKFLRFEKANNKLKKYDAILLNKKTNREKRVSFGAIKKDGTPYEQFKDNALGLYQKYNHLDKKRKVRYYKRHGLNAPKFSSKWFSHKYLW